MAIPKHVLQETAQWMLTFADHWAEETPRRIHSSAIDDGGAPQWTGTFERWLTRGERRPGDRYRNPEERLRITRAMRAVRKVAVREYEVLYRMMVLHQSVEEITTWLNERAIRGGHPERYRAKDTVAIIVSGCHKLMEWA